jgi:hypothetical protein
MAKSSKKVSKKRPGQALAARNAKVARAEYAGVESKPFDLKLLVAQVSAAQSAKAKEKKKNTEVRQQLDHLKKEEADLAVETLKADTESISQEVKEMKVSNKEIKKQRDQARRAAKSKAKSQLGPSADELVASEAVRLFGVMVGIYESSDQLATKQIAYIATFYDKALTSVNALPPGSATRLTLFAQLMELTKRFRKLRPSQVKEQERPEEIKKSPKEKLLGDGSQKTPSWKSLGAAMKLMGKRATSSVAPAVGHVMGAGAVSTASTTVKSIAKVSDGLRFIGRAIQQNGVDTLKWVGRKLSDLTSRVMGLFRSAKNFLTGGGAADMLSMGAIALGILPSIVEGLVKELKERFGENFVMGFISEKWEATKKYVSEFLSDFIDKAVTMIKELPGKLKELGGKAWDATKEGASKVWDANKKIATGAWNWLTGKDDKKSETKAPAKNEGPQDQFDRLVKEYDAAKTQAQKDEIANKMIQLVNATPSLKTETRVINAMKSRGININTKVNNATNTTTSTANANVAPSTSGGSTTTVSAPTSNTNVSVTPPPTETKPVTAEKPVPPPGVTSNGAMDDSGGATSTLSGGLTNASVPNNAANETLTFMNIASMGA